MISPPFTPGGLLANPHVQTLLNSSAPRSWMLRAGSKAFLNRSQQWIVDGGQGVRLQGYYTPHNPMERTGNKQGLVILFHGWEGSALSNYVLSTARHLHARGMDVFRLNFRDHGTSHHLNEGIFHSCLLDEVAHAVADVSGKISPAPVYLVGFSLGGNFALRVAMKAPELRLPLTHVYAVSPVISPHHVLDALEQGPQIYHYYFIRKWRRSLRLKQACFPELYDFSDWHKVKGLRAQTAFLIDRYTDFSSADEYLTGYSIAGERLVGLKVPTTLIASRDDPVVPQKDFLELPDLEHLECVFTGHGGHCGFLQDWRLNSWVDQFISARICQEVKMS